MGRGEVEWGCADCYHMPMIALSVWVAGLKLFQSTTGQRDVSTTHETTHAPIGLFQL